MSSSALISNHNNIGRRSLKTNDSPRVVLRGGGSDSSDGVKDFSGETSALFGNIRIPAALFAGASAGAAFSMPISHAASEGLKVGLVKRIYSFLMIGALASEILAVVISTLAVASLAMKPSSPSSTIQTSTLSAFINSNNYALAWVSARFHFLGGVLAFVSGLGLRAWVTIACPIFARAALGMICSATMLCLAFMQEMGSSSFDGGNGSSGNNLMGNIMTLPLKYLQLFFDKSKSSPIFAVAFLLYTLTFGYIGLKIPHILEYLAN